MPGFFNKLNNFTKPKVLSLDLAISCFGDIGNGTIMIIFFFAIWK